MKLRKGSQDATGLTFGIVASKFNKFVTSRLLTECVKALTKAGVTDGDTHSITSLRVHRITSVEFSASRRYRSSLRASRSS